LANTWRTRFGPTRGCWCRARFSFPAAGATAGGDFRINVGHGKFRRAAGSGRLVGDWPAPATHARCAKSARVDSTEADARRMSTATGWPLDVTTKSSLPADLSHCFAAFLLQVTD
jgi:hypothetical protein